ncbi:patatin-like phospholipase family protein [Arvimicrobium flavum]|uniref:patatin-like phospholipase family protein n=1 Tax=Arvimicrobium flavum TaxID=3393320 RepID=UPI00398CF950
MWRHICAGMVGLAVLAGCAARDVGPINTPVERALAGSPEFIPDPGDDGSTLVGLAFSGGGMRASAFAYGVLQGLDEIVIDEKPYRRTLVDDVRTVAGTSGGSVVAAYLGYKGKDGYGDFRERFLLQNPEAYMSTSLLSPAALTRAFSGGMNDRSGLARWLDERLFEGATFEAMKGGDRPIVWITASDIYNNTPFLFTYDTFAALCSDLDQLKVADAVAASAAFPVAFMPLRLDTPQKDCAYERPVWLTDALGSTRTPLRLQAYARALETYRNGETLKHVRLLDGGLTDNIGVTGLALERASATTPYGPLSRAEAVKIRNFLFIVADAGLSTDYAWGANRTGPGLPSVMRAVSDTAISAATRNGFDALDLALEQWRDELIRFRCGLPAEEVRRHRGTLAGWNCRDVKIVTEHLSFRDAAPEERKKLNAVPTRLRLEPDQIDLVVEAGRSAVLGNAGVQAVSRETTRHAGVRRQADD